MDINALSDDTPSLKAIIIEIEHQLECENCTKNCSVNLKDFYDMLDVKLFSNNVSENVLFLLEYIINHLPEGIFWKNSQAVYLGCNENYRQLLGFHSSQEIRGKTDVDIGLLSEENSMESFNDNEQGISKHPITYQEKWWILPNGNKRLLHINQIPLINAQKKRCRSFRYCSGYNGKEKPRR